jgi:hypothetical protein
MKTAYTQLITMLVTTNAQIHNSIVSAILSTGKPLQSITKADLVKCYFRMQLQTTQAYTNVIQ